MEQILKPRQHSAPTAWESESKPASGPVRPVEFLETAQDSRQSSIAMRYRNYRHLVERAVEVFGDEIKASRWLSTPSPDFDGRVPLQVAQAADFAVDIENTFEPIFVRIEHGIYS
jgi:uncharacterized protein (DUF2384 family)